MEKAKKIPEAMSAKVNRLAIIQESRLGEVEKMSQSSILQLRTEMAMASKLPRRSEHFDKHGIEFADLGVTTEKELEELFLAHLRRNDLRYFSYISTQSKWQYRHWVLMGVDNDVAVLYNETTKQHWSIIHQPGLLANAKGWWIEVVQWEPLKVEKW